MLNVNNKLHTGFSKLIIKNLNYPIVLKGQYLIELLNHAWRNLKQDHKLSVFIFGQQDQKILSITKLWNFPNLSNLLESSKLN